MPTPWLSVIIPTYNGELFLAQALESIVAQGERDLECIVVDDGSTDSTMQIVNAFSDKLPITLRQTRRTGNWVSNSNLALAMARGEYACFLHQDDLWLANRLQVIKGFLARYPAADLFICPATFVDRQGKAVGQWRCPLPGMSGPLDSDLLRRRLLVQNFIAIPSPVFRRKTALDRGGLDDSLWYTADWDFWLKLAASQTIYFPQPLAAFRLHGQSQTVQRSFDVAGFQRQLETVVERYVDRLPVDGRAREKIRQRAMFSIQVNTALVSRLHRIKISYGRLLAAFFRLGPLGWRQYLRDSRLVERIAARLRARIALK